MHRGLALMILILKVAAGILLVGDAFSASRVAERYASSKWDQSDDRQG